MAGNTKNTKVRTENRNRVFRYINQFEYITRQEIALELGISAPTVMQMVNELTDMGLIVEKGELKSTGGRKPKAIAPNREAVSSLGIDITRNHLSIVATDLSERVLAHARISKPFRAEKAYYKSIAEELEQFRRQYGAAKEKILGVGISIPGIVNRDENKISYSHILKVRDFPCSEIGQYIGYPTVLLNDANAAAVTEMRGPRQKGLVYLSLSNSVGGSILLGTDPLDTGSGICVRGADAGIWGGSNWRSGEFGHMVLDRNGPACYCGKNGCLDVYCSALKLASLADGSLDEFFAGVRGGNSRYQEAFRHYLSYLAVAVENLHMVFDCDVVLGGYVGGYMDEHMDVFRQMIGENNIFEGSGDYVKSCRYKVEAAALGAAQHYIKEYIKEI